LEDPRSLHLPPALQVPHVLIVLLIETGHILEDRHFTVPNRRNPIIKGALVERIQKVIPAFRVMRRDE